MKIELECGDVHFEWFDWKPVEIETDKYIGFEIDYRLGSWHVRGVYIENKERKSKELSKCQASFCSLKKFIKSVDKPILEFCNTHNAEDFPEQVKKLLE